MQVHHSTFIFFKKWTSGLLQPSRSKFPAAVVSAAIKLSIISASLRP